MYTEEDYTPEIQAPVRDSVLYINKLGYFPETDEFYVSLTSTKPLNEEDFHLLSRKADSLVFENDDMGRFRIPMATAAEYFNFSNLEEIKVYNTQHQFITKARFARAEYLSSINGYFVAVFRPEHVVAESDADFYCLGTADVGLEHLVTQPVESKELTERIKKELSISPQYVWHVEHVHVEPYNATFSIFAFSRDNGETISYLTEFKEDSLSMLYKLREEYTLSSILPLPFKVNAKPVFLLHITLPESDAVDEYVVGAFNGSGYEILENNRVRL